LALLVNDVTPRVQYVATASQTVFAYPFAIFADADLKVYQTLSGVGADDTADILTLTTDYTVSDAGVTAGGNVTLVTSAAAGDIITIQRDLAVARTTDYQNLGDLASTSLNDDLDKLVMMVQQQEEALAGRLLQFHQATDLTSISTKLPDPVASEFLRWNAAKTALESVLLADVSTDLSAISTYMLTVIDDTTSAEARGTLGAAGLVDANTFSKTQTWTQGADAASANALALGDGNSFDITGTTNITSISTKGVGTHVTLQFDAELILVHHATDLILPTGANITTKAGDIAVFYEYATGTWRLISYSTSDTTTDLVISDGFKFPATQVASADSNTLDDYEEGTWTPNIRDVSSNNVTLSSAVGTYTKIGRIVTLEMYIVTSSLGSASGQLYLDGLPFPASATANNYGSLQSHDGASLSTGVAASIKGWAIVGAAIFTLVKWSAATGTAAFAASDLTASGTFKATAIYHV